jgi:hypothetical protein
MHSVWTARQDSAAAQRLPVLVVVAALVGGLLAACGAGPGSERVITGRQPASELLQAWAAFPVDASTRPLVLVGGLVLGPSKFLDGQAKLDFMNGAFDGPPSLPAGPASANGYPVISAAAAIALLRSQSHGAPPSPSTSHLTITDARFGAETFLTDRGERTLPAWLFTFARVDGTVAVLAVSPHSAWLPAGLAAGDFGASFVNGARIARDHRTLTAGFTGAPAGTGPCTASYALSLTESPTAVVVTVTESSHNPSPQTVCTLVGYLRTATAVLAVPLGARVVVDAVSGQPVAVVGTA